MNFPKMNFGNTKSSKHRKKKSFLNKISALYQRYGVVPLTIVALLVVFLTTKGRWMLLGYGATRRGGFLGRMIDNFYRKVLFNRAVVLQKENFKRIMGYELPPTAETTANTRGVQVLTQSYIYEHTIRTMTRRAVVKEHYNASITQQSQCILRIIQPNAGNWYRRIGWKLWSKMNQISALEQNTTDQALVFSEEEMEAFLRKFFNNLYTSVLYAVSSQDERIQLFGIAAVYHFGGLFINPTIRTSSDLKKALAPDLWFWIKNNVHECNQDTSNVENNRLWVQSINDESIHFLAATPRHPNLKCILAEIVANNQNSMYHNNMSSIFKYINITQWDPSCSPRCCPLLKLKHTRQKEATVSADGSQSLANVLPSIVRPVKSLQSLENISRFDVTITENEVTASSQSSLGEKERISQTLEKAWCSAGWFCNRCLRLPFRGSLYSCRSFCRPCYERTVCTNGNNNSSNQKNKRKEVVIEVLVHENTNSIHYEKRIPRIIHQTWFEELTVQKYPHLNRLQNSWKSSGWEYRFYTDDNCRDFIIKHYPQRFIHGYDQILPGAFKADFFRLLVLFVHGGVYADIDVHLDSNLDHFIPNDLSFFVPRDVPLDYWPNSNYCLWNGLLGSSPGNPIVAKAIEDVLNTISNRVDYYDLERNLCSLDPKIEIWKLRTIPILLLTGPCRLGMSVNAVIGSESVVQGFNLGWLNTINVPRQHDPPNHFWGDALLLLADRYDLGELRFTDVDRNLLIASSNQDRIARSAIQIPHDDDFVSDVPLKTESIHYSKSESDIVGEYGVYKDYIARNENVRIHITHRYV